MSSSKTKNKNPFKEEPTMKLEENNIIVKRSYKTVYKCDDSIVKVFNEEHPKSDVFNEALITARIEETGLDIPKVKGVSLVEGKWALEIEYKDGKTMEDMMNSEVGFCRKALQAFEENGISIEHMPSGIDTMTVFVHQEEFEGKEQQVISSIRRLTHPDVIDLEADLGLIAVVGRGMKSTRGTAGRIFSALAHANINVKMIDQGSSELNIIIGVSNDDFEAAIKAIYDIFVETRL